MCCCSGGCDVVWCIYGLYLIVSVAYCVTGPLCVCVLLRVYLWLVVWQAMFLPHIPHIDPMRVHYYPQSTDKEIEAHRRQ